MGWGYSGNLGALRLHPSQKQATAMLPGSKITHCKSSYKWTPPQTATHPRAKSNYYSTLKKDQKQLKAWFPVDLSCILN